MLTPDKVPPAHNPINGAYTLSRNNLEFAGIVVYFFSLAVIFAITIIVMLCQTGTGANERAANDHQPKVMASFADPR